jgi:hypothetical protein
LNQDTARLSLQIFSIVVRVITQPIKKGEPIATDRDCDLRAKLNIASGVATNDGPDVSLVEAHDSIRDASAD